MSETIRIPEGYQLVKVSDFEYQIVPKERKLPKDWEEFCKLTHMSFETVKPNLDSPFSSLRMNLK